MFHKLDRKLTLVIGSLMMLAVLSACGWAVSAQSQAAICESTFERGNSFENRCDLKVEPGAASANLSFNADMSAGSLHWTLVDPSNTSVREGDVLAGSPVNENISFEQPVRGTWSLILQITDGKGEYRGEWTAE